MRSVLLMETEDWREIKYLIAFRSHMSESEKWTKTTSPPLFWGRDEGPVLSFPYALLIEVTSWTKMMRFRQMAPTG